VQRPLLESRLHRGNLALQIASARRRGSSLELFEKHSRCLGIPLAFLHGAHQLDVPLRHRVQGVSRAGQLEE
jgi:hypothetical protein